MKDNDSSPAQSARTRTVDDFLADCDDVIDDWEGSDDSATWSADGTHEHDAYGYYANPIRFGGNVGVGWAPVGSAMPTLREVNLAASHVTVYFEEWATAWPNDNSQIAASFRPMADGIAVAYDEPQHVERVIREDMIRELTGIPMAKATLEPDSADNWQPAWTPTTRENHLMSETAKTTVYGASDDLIEFDGAISGEAYARQDGRSVAILTAPDGGTLTITIAFCDANSDGWDIRVESWGSATPSWPLAFVPRPGHFGDEGAPALEITHPAGTTATCDGEPVR